MDKIGNTICITYSSIGLFYEEIIYLEMDNMGTNGKNETVLEYSEYLEENYNIVVQQQFSQSPKTNMFNLGSLMTMQSKVKK